MQGGWLSFLDARRSEATIASGRVRKLINFLKRKLRNGAQHHLSNTIPVLYEEIFLPGVVENDAHSMAKTTIHGARSVEDRDAMLESMTASRSDLNLQSFRDAERKPRGNQRAISRGNHNILIEASMEVRSGVSRMLVRGDDSLRVSLLDEAGVLEIGHVESYPTPAPLVPTPPPRVR
jgi:hypothetical protein